MKDMPGRNGGRLRNWEPGESGNPKGRKKGLMHWVHELQGKKSFIVKIEMKDEDGEITTVDRTITLLEPAAKLAATQLILKAVQGDMEAIRELNKIEQSSQNREALYRSVNPVKGAPQSTPFTIIDPLTNQITQLDIGESDE